ARGTMSRGDRDWRSCHRPSSRPERRAHPARRHAWRASLVRTSGPQDYEYWGVSPSLVTAVAVASIVTFGVVAQLPRAAGVARRGETVARSGGLARYVAYFFFVPYIVIAARPGPEIDVPEPLRWIGIVLIVAGVAFSRWAIATLGRPYALELGIPRDPGPVSPGPY